MAYRPGSTIWEEFVTSSATGAAVNADSTPTCTLARNGTDDGAVTLTVTNVDTGRYKVTGTVPSGYASGDSLHVAVAATIGGVAAKAVLPLGQVVVQGDFGDLYHADICFTRDQANTQDEWTCLWMKNGAGVTGGITSPTIQVVKRADGTDLVAATAMTAIGSTGYLRYNEATNRVTPGEAVIAVVSATIDGSTRVFRRIVGRDS